QDGFCDLLRQIDRGRDLAAGDIALGGKAALDRFDGGQRRDWGPVVGQGLSSRYLIVCVGPLPKSEGHDWGRSITLESPELEGPGESPEGNHLRRAVGSKMVAPLAAACRSCDIFLTCDAANTRISPLP